ncbi:MAG: AMP-binding protein, partial [Schleiferiaceae bacterium]|nr:AMP-binding protein [Schleiferiaceae bacterium]
MKFEFGKNTDFRSVEDIQHLQFKLLVQHFNLLKNKSPYYQQTLKDQALNRWEDLKSIPTTSKKDIQKNNLAFFASEKKEIVEFVTTSGTTSKPIKIGLTKSDLKRLAYNEARSLEIAGINANHTVQLTTTLDKRFMAGIAYYLGLTEIGATTIRTGHSSMKFQQENIAEFQPDALIAVPSFLLKLAETIEQPKNLNHIICIGEPIRDSSFNPNHLSKKILNEWNVDLRSTYASTEMATAFTECSAHQGGHVLPELMVVEILDENGNEVATGELGEVTVTPLQMEGTPLLRYRTGDLARLYSEPCSCGRNTARLGPIEGRKEQRIKLKGTTLFAQQIAHVIEVSFTH